MAEISTIPGFKTEKRFFFLGGEGKVTLGVEG